MTATTILIDGDGATVASLVRRATAKLKSAGIETPDLDARVIIGHVLGLDWAGLVRVGDRVLSGDVVALADALVARRHAREPVAYLTGVKEFWGLPFAVDASVLIPRPDSETVVEAALDVVRAARNPASEKQLSVIDLGTGSGCLLLSFLNECRDAVGVGVDVSVHAVAMARRNARALGLESRARFLVGDWAAAIGTAFDVVLVNPPYVTEESLSFLPPDVFQYEPSLALDGGRDGLEAYRELTAVLPRLVKKGGHVACEIGAGQAAAVRQIVFDGSDLMFLYDRPDLSGQTRCLVGHKVTKA